MNARRFGDKDQKPLTFDRIFILGGRGLDENDWRSHFSEFGNIKGVFMKRDESGGTKGRTHIKFEKTSQACLAQENMDGRSLPKSQKPIKVLVAMDKNSLEIDCEEDKMLQRLFIRFPKTTTKEQLKETFSAYGDVIMCHVVTSRDTGESRGLGFVKFAKQSQAALALEECDPSFRAKWADVRMKSEETIQHEQQQQQAGGGMRGGGEIGAFGGMGSLASGMMDIIQSKTRMGAGGFGAAGDRGQRMGSSTDRGMGGGFGTSGGMMDSGFGMGGSRSMGGAMASGGRMMGSLSGSGGGQRGGLSGIGGGQMGGMSDIGGGQMGGASWFGEQGQEAAIPAPPKPPAAPGDPMFYIESRSAMGSDRLEAKVPEGMNLKQVFALFNICPGLTSCTLNPKTGIAKLQYESANCASFAQEKTNGLNYAGHVIECNFGKISGNKALEETANQLQQTLMQMTMSGNPDPEQLSKLVESIQKTTEAIESQDETDREIAEDDADTLEMVSWCSVPLPKKKAFASGNADIAERLFFVSVPEIFSNELVEDVFCRFGNLIKCRFQADKRFGFAHFATKESADLAQQTLHGESILNNHLKVEYASKPGGEAARSSGDRKRPADW